MSSESGEKPPGGGRPAADTPNRIVVRSLDGGNESVMGASDTAVAAAITGEGLPKLGSAETPMAGTMSLTEVPGGKSVGKALEAPPRFPKPKPAAGAPVPKAPTSAPKAPGLVPKAPAPARE